MRVASITWNPNTDNTKIKFSEEFLTADPLLQADILSDLSTELGQRYLDTAKNIFASYQQEKK